MIKGGDNDSTHTQVIPESVATEAKSILETVVSSGTGNPRQHRRPGQWGKTGTTENNGDAWFCGAISEDVTACVWVGYEDSTTPMTTLYNGGPVMGGTFPALIWANVINAWEQIKAERGAEEKEHKGGSRSAPTGLDLCAGRALDRTGSGTIGSGAERPETRGCGGTAGAPELRRAPALAARPDARGGRRRRRRRRLA